MKITHFVLLISLPLAAAPAIAGFPGEVPDRIQVTFGGMIATVDSQAGAGGVKGGIGTTILFEDLFDIPIGQRTGFLNGSWRFTGRSYLDFGWLKIDRSGSRVLDKDLDFKGYTFLSGSEVTGEIDTSFPYVAYRYDFLRSDPVKISGSAGVNYMDLGAFLTTKASVVDPDGNLTTGSTKIGSTIGLPVPLLGFQLDWAVSRRNSIVVYGRVIYVDYSGLRANISQQSYHWNFHAWKHFAVGAGIDKISINIPKYEKEDRFATFKYELSGVTLFGKVSF